MESQIDKLAMELSTIVGTDNVVRDATELEFFSTDVYSTGVTAAMAVKPVTTESVSAVMRAITKTGFAVVTRGGGMSYTGGYTPIRGNTVLVDMSSLDAIQEVNEEDMVITVEAGVTWKQIFETLKPKGLRLPFFGTFSGSRATVGGGMSNGALFMATARYGTAAEIVLGMDVVVADGSVIKTGQTAFKNGRPCYRSYGPDLTGLFVHDAGVLGIKTKISMRMIQTPAYTDYVSFIFSDARQTARGLSAVARSGAAEEAYVFDPVSTKNSLADSDLRQDFRRLLGVVKGQSSFAKGLRDGAKLVMAGRNFVEDGAYSLHVVCAGRSQQSVDADLACVRRLAEQNDGAEIANSIPKAMRSNPFEPLNSILGTHGERWAALNAKVAHSDAEKLVQGVKDIFEKYQEDMKKHQVFWTHLMIAISNHVFSFEPVLRWYDEWLPVHKRIPEPAHLKKLKEPEANLKGRELVNKIRDEVVNFLADYGAASTQIGKTYRYFDSLDSKTGNLVMSLKRAVDPDGLINPGGLRLP